MVSDKPIDVKIIVGSNYGDEGKGLATHYFAQQAAAKGHKVLNILMNGSCQRGHTVELKDGTRHVFSHFGSGTFDGADTYLSEFFYLNPIFFRQEYELLAKELGHEPVVYASARCELVTPYDMLINQIIEESRGSDRHGSCGFGVYETNRRLCSYEYLSFLDDEDDIRYSLREIRDHYFPSRMMEYGFEPSVAWAKLKAIVPDLDALDEHFMDDFVFMMNHVQFKDYNLDMYDTVICECAQGIGLDKRRESMYPHVTASDTTSETPMVLLAVLKGRLARHMDIEICYITRAYLTRHGVGPLENECNKEDINPAIEDQTNVANEYQGTIRYGEFDIEQFKWRIMYDRRNAWLHRNINTVSSVFVTHLNYTDGEMTGNCTLKEIFDLFKKGYKSYTKYAEDVIEVIKK